MQKHTRQFIWLWVLAGLLTTVFVGWLWFMCWMTKGTENRSVSIYETGKVVERYDAEGQLISKLRLSPYIDFTRNTYDNTGNRICSVYTNNDGAPGLVVETALYDETGRMVEEVQTYYILHRGLPRRDQLRSVSEYDENGYKVRLDSYMNGELDGYRLYESDADGNLLSESFYHSDGTMYLEYQWTYDAQGNLTEYIERDFINDVIVTQVQCDAGS